MRDRFFREISVLIAYLLLLGVLAARAPSFFSADQIRAMLVSAAPVLVAAVGMTLVILTRQIDISIGSQFSICGIAAGLLAKTGLPLPWVALATLAIGAGLGALNGVLVALFKLPSIVVTLATMVTLREALRWSREGEFVRNLPADFQWFGMGQATGQALIVGIAGAILLASAWSLRYLAAGRMVYATGSDAEAARLVGIRPQRVLLSVFLTMGALTGLAALLNAVRFVDVDPNAGLGLEMQVIAAVVVGGTSISGGRGTVWGTLIGIALLATIGPALVFLKTEAHWERAIQGAIILVAVAADAFYARREN
jgi:rhamnose transport system permease protein